MKSLHLILIGSMVTLASFPAAAQFQKPEDAIKYRQSTLTVMAHHFGRLNAMAQGRVPFDAKAAAENADIVLTLSKLPFVAFGEGTDKGRPNRAKPEVWREQAKFKAAAEKMHGEVVKLEAAAKTGNLDAIKAAVGAVGSSCKACHDDFQSKEYSN